MSPDTKPPQAVRAMSKARKHPARAGLDTARAGPQIAGENECRTDADALEAPPPAASSGVRYWRTAPSSGHCPVDLPAMPHPHDQDDELTLYDLVDDAVVPDAQPVTVVVPGEFPDVGIRTARIVPQRRKRLQDRKRG
jgi:hypothetical protein